MQWEVIAIPEKGGVDELKIHINSPVRLFRIPAHEAVGKIFRFVFFEKIEKPYLGKVEATAVD